MRIKAYKIHIHRAPMMAETGITYSFHPWDTNTDRYEGEDREIELDLNEALEVYETEHGETMLQYHGPHGDRPMGLTEAVAMRLAKVVEP